MGNLVTVTIETDGHRDFVRFPSGERYIIGTTSVMKLVGSLVTGVRNQRLALERFCRDGEAVVTLDPDKMFEMLAPRPIRRANLVSPFMTPLKRHPSTGMEGTIMSNAKHILDHNLTNLEGTIRAMSARVASGDEVSPALIKSLREAAVHLTDFGDQTKNDAFYGLGAPKVDTVEDDGWTPPASVTHPGGKTAAAALWKYTCPETEKDFYLTEKKTTVKSPYTGKSFSTKPEKDTMSDVAQEIKSDAAEAKAKKTKKASFVLRANTDMASEVLAKLAETSEKIASLEEAGKPFNAARAQADVHALVREVHTVLANEDLAEDESEALQETAKKASELHSVFASAKV